MADYNRQHVGLDGRRSSRIELTLGGGFEGERLYADVTSTLSYERMQAAIQQAEQRALKFAVVADGASTDYTRDVLAAIKAKARVATTTGPSPSLSHAAVVSLSLVRARRWRHNSACSRSRFGSPSELLRPPPPAEASRFRA